MVQPDLGSGYAEMGIRILGHWAFSVPDVRRS